MFKVNNKDTKTTISGKEMVKLPNFGHIYTSAIEFDSRNKILLVKS